MKDNSNSILIFFIIGMLIGWFCGLWFIFLSFDVSEKEEVEIPKINTSDEKYWVDSNSTLVKFSEPYITLCSNKGFFVTTYYTEENYNKFKDDYVIKVLNLTEENCEEEEK